MRICSLEELHKNPVMIDGILAVRQKPVYRSLEITDRVHNGVMVVEQGSCVYEWDDQRAELKKGACIYLPYGSSYRMMEHSEDFTMIRVNFAVKAQDGEPIHFSKGPLVICKQTDQLLSEIVARLLGLFMNAESLFLRNACIYELLNRIAQLYAKKEEKPIFRVISHIRDHYTEEICCKDLADLCFMSPAQMYRHFHEEMGCTPTEYKNRLRIEQAKNMLRDDDLPISEIAFLMGYENTAYFCKLFKREIGETPSQYRKKHKPLT